MSKSEWLQSIAVWLQNTQEALTLDDVEWIESLLAYHLVMEWELYG